MARWVHEIAKKRSDAEFELVDIKDFDLKAAAFVSYGSASGTRAVEHLRLVMAELQIAPVRAQVALSLRSEFEEFKVFKPGPQPEATVTTMLDQLVAWGGALRTLRRK